MFSEPLNQVAPDLEQIVANLGNLGGLAAGLCIPYHTRQAPRILCVNGLIK